MLPSESQFSRFVKPLSGSEEANIPKLLKCNCCCCLLLGTKEIYVDVDDNGKISMVFECSEMTEGSQFVWYKNYQEMTDTSRLTIVSEKGR